MAARSAIFVWTAMLAALWIVFTYCTAVEPILRDGWGHNDWHRWFELTPKNLYNFGHDNYLYGNPRLGQVLTLLVFTHGPWHAIVTPLVELGVFFMLAALALGRWPSVKRADDALVFATILAMITLTAPQVGAMLFYRPFTGNYLFGFALNLLLLVPYRFQYESPRRRVWLAPLLFVLGFAAGVCNEHTGPTVMLLLVLATIACWRASAWAARIWMLAGAVGFAAGSLALFYAPGQNYRYSGLAQKQSLVERIADRGVGGNWHYVWLLLYYAWPLLLWGAIAGVSWWRKRTPIEPRVKRIAIVLAASGLAIVLTLLASPKIGPRLYFASMAFVATAVAAIVHTQLVERWSKLAAIVLAAGFTAYAAFKCVTTYRTLGAEFDVRYAAILKAANTKTSITVAPYSIGPSRWWIGDDFLVPQLRARLAEEFGLSSIELGQRVATPVDPGDDP